MSDRIARIGRWGAVAVATSPAWYVPVTLFPAVSGKMPFVLTLIAGLGAVAAWRPASVRLPRLVVVSVGAFLAISACAAAFGVDSAQSVWGSVSRATGLVTTAAFVVWCLSAPRLLDAQGWRRFWAASAVTAALTTAILAAEFLFPAVRALFHEDARFSGLFGNPAYLAGYLTMSAALALLCASAARPRMRRWIAALAVAAVLGVFLTGSRSGIVGVAVAALAAGSVAVVRLRGRRRARILAGAAVAAALIGSLFVMPQEALVRLGWPVPLLRIVDARGYVDDPTRLIQWQIALEAFRARPLLGWGPENYQAAFDRHYRPELLRYSFTETVSDKPHNYPLELLVAGGVPLLLAWVGLLVAAAVLIARGMRSGALTTAEAAGAAGAIAAYLVHGAFLFETVPTSLLFFSLLAWLGARSASASASAPARMPHAAQAGTVAFAAVALLAGPLTVPAGYAALRTLEADTTPAWTQNGRFALAAWSVQGRDVVKQLARDFVNRSALPGGAASFYTDNVRIVRAAVAAEAARHPGDFTLLFMLGQLYALEGELYGSPEALQQSLAALEKADAISPRRQAVKFQLAKTLLLGEQPAQAVAVTRAVVEEDPTLQEPHWFLGLALSAAGDRAAAADEITRSLDLGRRAAWTDAPRRQEMTYVIALFDEQKRYADIVPLYEILIAHDPANAEWHVNLAATYAALGKPELAALEAQRAAVLNPAFAEEARRFEEALTVPGA